MKAKSTATRTRPICSGGYGNDYGPHHSYTRQANLRNEKKHERLRRLFSDSLMIEPRLFHLLTIENRPSTTTRLSKNFFSEVVRKGRREPSLLCLSPKSPKPKTTGELGMRSCALDQRRRLGPMVQRRRLGGRSWKKGCTVPNRRKR